MLRVKCLHCLTPRASILTVLQVPGLSAGRTNSYPFTVCSVRGRWCKAGSCRLHFQCGYSNLREQEMKSQTISSLPFFLLLMCMYLLLDMAAGPLTSTRGHCCFLCCPPQTRAVPAVLISECLTGLLKMCTFLHYILLQRCRAVVCLFFWLASC